MNYKNHLKDTTTSTTYSTTYSTTGSTTTEEQFLFTDKMPTKKPLKSTTAPRVTTRPTETINLITVDKEDDDDAQER